MCTLVCICMYVYIYIYTCQIMFVYMYIYIYIVLLLLIIIIIIVIIVIMIIYIYIYIHIHVYIYIHYIYIYIHIYTHTRDLGVLSAPTRGRASCPETGIWLLTWGHVVRDTHSLRDLRRKSWGFAHRLKLISSRILRAIFWPQWAKLLSGKNTSPPGSSHRNTPSTKKAQPTEKHRTIDNEIQ